VKGKIARILNKAKNPSGFAERIWQTILSGTEWKGEYLSTRLNRETYWESVLISPIVDDDGIISNYIIVIEDITDQKRMIEELVSAKEKAEKSDLLKSTFLANMSHEIRTPMNAITGFASMLSDPDLSISDRRRFAEIIQLRSDDLMHLINDLLDISRIESGNATMVKESLSINTLLDEMEAVANQKLKRSKKEAISLVVTKGLPDMSSIISSDGFVIRQVFANIIENAIKFTEAGTIRFGYNPPEKGFITCFVTDTGIGISKENQQVIFEHFRQADVPDAHRYGGTGLGLSICKGSLALMGGEIHVESEPGEGSTFIFTLPYETPVNDPLASSAGDREGASSGTQSTVSETKPPLPRWTGKRILLVEDEQTNMEYLQIILRRTGAELVTVFSGNELRKLFQDLDSFDLVLLDVRLPDANGWELAVELKKLRPSLPVIAQTAYAMSSDRQKAEEAGCDGYVSKPIKKEQLLNLISEKLKN
jgi:signal transduction histidine kinase